MFKYILSISLITFVLIVSGCASKKSQGHIQFEKDKLLHDLYTLRTCRIDSAKKLDDGVSSAKSIAQVVIKECEKESNHVMNANLLDQSEKYRLDFYKQMNGVETSGVIGMILKQRSEKIK